MLRNTLFALLVCVFYSVSIHNGLTYVFTTDQAIDGRNIDDPAAVSRNKLILAQHLSNDVFSRQKDGLRVHGHGHIPPLLGCLMNFESLLSCLNRYAGVIDQPIRIVQPGLR